MPFPKGQKNEEKPQEDVELENDKKEESKQLEKIKRSREDVKKIFRENYLKKHGIDPDDPAIKESGLDKKIDALMEDLTDRELANSRNMSKVIGQKIKYRDSKPAIKQDGKKEDDDAKEDDDKVAEHANDLTAFRNIERKKAIANFLPGIVKEFKDEGLTIESVYAKMDKFYAEDPEDIRREDFTKNLETAFRAAYPHLYEEKLRREEAKDKLDEESPIIGGGGHLVKPKKKSSESSPDRGTRKIKNLSDWFKGK